MLGRHSLNHRRIQSSLSQINSNQNQKENIQKHFNRSKKSTKLTHLEPNISLKPIDNKHSYKSQNDCLNLSLTLNMNNTLHSIKPKLSSRLSLPKPKIQIKQIVNIPQQTNTQQACKIYGEQILKTSVDKFFQKGTNFLKNHQINANLRAKMLDWMIEVIKSYKFSNKTYFASVNIMDRYFTQEQKSLPVTQLHIIGVQSMLIATKMEQISPLKLKTTYEKIVHKKISKQSLIAAQAKIISKLNFKTNSWTFFDFAMFKINMIQSQKKVLYNNMQKIQEICSYLGKFILIDFNTFTKYEQTILADTLVLMALQICKIGVSYEVQFQALECKKQVIEVHNEFKKNYKGLNNIYRFGDQKIIKIVEMYCTQNS